VLAIGQALDLRVVAEGVETEGQRDWLRGAGCARAQGWLYARALPPDDLADWSRQRT
jgi:sensor c-di-GMP phosphodiesterase-like protein